MTSSLLEHKSQAETHTVFNQPAPLEHYNAYGSDIALQYWVKVFGGEWAQPRLLDYGARCGGDLLEAGFLANAHRPTFHSHDRFGKRIDLVKFHPAYHELMRTAIEAGVHSLPWREPKSGAHVARAALEYLHMQADSGSGCPLTMTFAAVPAIQHTPAVAQEWLPKIFACQYDGRNIPYFEKGGVTIGMAMTEKQGGSDVRANTTRAYPVGNPDGEAVYEIVGHKWFCSAPMCDAFLVLAQTEKGLSCFLLPRWRPDGSKNPMLIQRLKDKLGNISNASAEVEYRGAFAWLLGEAGQGIRTIIDMVAMTRFDCMVGSSALMRGAVAQAIHHTADRCTFGKSLHEHVLMQNVLADLALETEAALAMSLRVAHALDQAATDTQQKLFSRLATPIGKYWICKRAPHLAYEAMESIGGVAYVEDNILPRIYREAPVNAIWEGSGNIQCLDVLRAIGKEPEVLNVFMDELAMANGCYPAYDHFLTELKAEFADPVNLEYRSRALVDKLAIALQASVLIRHGENAIADAFVSSRIEGKHGINYGTLATGVDCWQIMKRAQPKV